MTTSVSTLRLRLLWLPAIVLAAGCATGLVSTDDAPLTPSSSSDAGASSLTNDASAPSAAPSQADDATAPPPATGDDDAAPPPSGDDDDAAPPPVTQDAAPPPVTVDAAPPPVVIDAAPPPSSTCPGYADPTTTAACNSGCTTHTCTANGCYNGYYCELSALKCVAKPSTCP